MKTKLFSSASRLPVTLLAIGLASGLASAQSAPSETKPAQSPATESSSTSSDFATTGGDPFAMGEKVIFAGVGLGSVYGVYGDQSIPPLTVGMDYAFHKYLTAGGIFSYSKSTWGYLGGDISYTYMTIAARGTFHPTMWFKNMNIPLDPYGAATVGYNIVSVSGSYAGYTSGSSYSIVGLSVGARYWFAPNFAAQAEAGFGLGLLNLGIAYKF